MVMIVGILDLDSSFVVGSELRSFVTIMTRRYIDVDLAIALHSTLPIP